KQGLNICATKPIPADLFELQAHFETWRTNRKYLREPIPDELWNAAADLSRRYPPSLVGRVLKIDPSRLKKFLLKRPARTSTRKKLQATFLQLPTEIALPKVESPLQQITSLPSKNSARVKSGLGVVGSLTSPWRVTRSVIRSSGVMFEGPWTWVTN